MDRCTSDYQNCGQLIGDSVKDTKLFEICRCDSSLDTSGGCKIIPSCAHTPCECDHSTFDQCLAHKFKSALFYVLVAAAFILFVIAIIVGTAAMLHDCARTFQAEQLGRRHQSDFTQVPNYYQRYVNLRTGQEEWRLPVAATQTTSQQPRMTAGSVETVQSRRVTTTMAHNDQLRPLAARLPISVQAVPPSTPNVAIVVHTDDRPPGYDEATKNAPTYAEVMNTT